jgi:hypothetical protein
MTKQQMITKVRETLARAASRRGALTPTERAIRDIISDYEEEDDAVPTQLQ